METALLSTATPRDRDAAVLREVAELTAGEPVALPTETVYGLAADALRPAAHGPGGPVQRDRHLRPRRGRGAHRALLAGTAHAGAAAARGRAGHRDGGVGNRGGADERASRFSRGDRALRAAARRTERESLRAHQPDHGGTRPRGTRRAHPADPGRRPGAARRGKHDHRGRRRAAADAARRPDRGG